MTDPRAYAILRALLPLALGMMAGAVAVVVIMALGG